MRVSIVRAERDSEKVTCKGHIPYFTEHKLKFSNGYLKQCRS